jgi:hypothetical protein
MFRRQAFSMNNYAIAALLVATAGVEVPASADVLVSLTYDDLSGSFDTATNLFTARAVNNAILQSSGDTSRLASPSGNAFFDAGFVSLPTQANFVLTCTVVLTGQFTATGSGTFSATDVDGDAITGSFDGNWGRPAPGFVFFSFARCSVQLNPTGDGVFEGTAGGAWDMLLPATTPYDGVSPQLVFGGSTFFASTFSNRALGVTIQVVPAPGALALLGLGAAASIPRRSR